MGTYVEIGNVRLVAGIEYYSILDISITSAKNNYGSAKIRIETEASSASRLNTDENPTKIILETKDGVSLFKGVCASYGISQDRGYCVVDILAYSNGYQLDRKRKTKNYQQPETLEKLATAVMAEYDGIVQINKNIVLKGIESQQNETDWEFLVRIAGREGLSIFENSSSDVPHIVMGTYGFQSVKEIPDMKETGISRNLAEYELIQMNVEADTMPYQYDSRYCKTSGAQLMAGYLYGNEIITSTNIVNQGGLLINSLEMTNVASERASYAATGKSIAVKTSILTGEVIAVDGTNVKVQFETEDNQDMAMAVWMPYENTMNNYFYCMPDIGDKVYCYYEDGGNGVCLGSLRTNTDNADFDDYSAKMITTQDDMIRFMGTALEFLTNRSMVEAGSSIMSYVSLDQEAGISMHSNGDVIFDATDGNLELTATAKAGDGMLEMYAVAAIRLSVARSSISVTGERIDIKAPVFYWEGTTKLSGYEHKEDEYQNWFDVGLDALQFGLDIIGMLPIPGVSMVADLVNAGISAARGDWFGCAMSLLGAIPVAGSLATAGKLGKKALNAAQTVTKVATKVGDVVSSAAKAAGMAKNLTKLTDMGKTLVKTVKFVMNAVDVGQAVITDVQLVVMVAQGEFDPFNDADDASLLLRSMRGNLTLYKNGKNAKDAIKKKKTAKVTAPEGDTATAKQTTKKTTQGDTQTEKKCINDPVDVITGSMSINHTDMVVRYTGGVFEVARSYESVHKNNGCMLGDRWFTPFDECICTEGNIYTVMLDGLHLEKFEKNEGGFVSLREQDKSVQLFETKDGYCYKENKNYTERYFDDKGRLTAHYDRNQDGFQVVYCGNQMEEVIFTGGARLSFVWSDNKVQSITDIMGRTVAYRYDNNNLKEVVCVDGGVIRYDYTEEGRLRQICDQNGKNYVTNEFDRKGRVVRQVLSNGEEFVTFYDDAKKENTFLTVSTGERIIYTYDHRKLPLKEIYADGTYIEKRYDQWENVVYERDRKGNEIYREYNEQGKCVKERFPDGYIIYSTYDKSGYLIFITDNMGGECHYEYDEKGNLIREQKKVDETKWQIYAYERDSHGRVLSVTDANGNADRYEYGESLREPIKYQNREGSVYRYLYDKAGRLVEERNEFGTRYYGYDAFDRVVIATDEEEHTTYRKYDKIGNLTAITYPESYKNKYEEPDVRLFYNDLDQLIRIEDAEGGVKIMQRDAQGRIVEASAQVPGEVNRYVYGEQEEPLRMIYPDGGIERRFYDAKGNIIKKILPEQYDEAKDDGDGTSFAYDSRERLCSVIGPDGEMQWKAEYDFHGNLIRVQTVGGGERRYRYNLLGWLVEERELLSSGESDHWSLVRYEYDATGNRIGELRYTENQSAEGAAGRVLHIQYQYDKEGRMLCKEDGNGAREVYEYDALGRMTRSIQYMNDEKKLTTEYRYTLSGQMKVKLQFSASGEVLAKTCYTYDANGNMIKTVTPLGHEIRKSYDRLNRVIKEVHDGKDHMIHNTKYYSYDVNGNLRELVSDDGVTKKTVRFEMDAAGRMSEVIYPDGSHKNVAYNKNGWISSFISPQMNQVKHSTGYTYQYDAYGRCQSVTGPSGNLLEQYQYNAGGQLISVYDGAHVGIEYQYDMAGRRTVADSTGGSSQKWEYSPWGQIRALTDGNGNTTSFDLDSWGRVTCVHKADGSEESYTYNPAGKMLTSKDGEGNSISYQYDERGNMTERVDALGNADTFTYDAENQMSSHSNRNGICTKYRYTMYGNLIERYVTEESAVQAGVEALRESYGYTGEGLLAYAIGGGMRYDYTYDLMGRVTGKSASGRKLLSYTYDADGNLLSRQDVSGKLTEYRYDIEGKLTEVYDNGVRQALYEYDNAGRKTRQMIGNSLQTEYAYNADGILCSLKTTLLEQMHSKLLTENHYRYDYNGNMVRKDTLQGGYAYGYDCLNRVANVKSPYGEESFSYDKSGNRISHSVNTAQEAFVEKYLYDAGNRLMSVEKLRDELEVEQYRYDKQGNMLSDGRSTYCYDAFNRCAMAEAEGLRQVNHYDAEGLRHEMEENGQLVRFIFSGNEVVVEEESDGNIIRYIRGLSLVSSDSEKARCYYHYASDEMGSITHITAGTEILNHYEYDVFGNTTVCEEQIPNRFRYTGQQYDAVTSQYYLRARFYNPVIGRFLQEDTYLGDGLNLFAYCQNNPLMYYDPSGYAGMVCADKYAQWKQFKDSGMTPAQALAATNKMRGTPSKYDVPIEVRLVNTGKTADGADLTDMQRAVNDKFRGDQFKAEDSFDASVDPARHDDLVRINHNSSCDLNENINKARVQNNNLKKKNQTSAELAEITAARQSAKPITSDTIMQKVIPESTLNAYLDNGWGTVGGCCAKAADSAPFTGNVKMAYEHLRLDYTGNPYKAMAKNGESMYVLRFTSEITPDNTQIPNRTNRNTPPCTENGFTGSSQYLIPETYYERSKIEEGAIFKIDNNGNESLVAIFDGSKFISVNSK